MQPPKLRFPVMTSLSLSGCSLLSATRLKQSKAGWRRKRRFVSADDCFLLACSDVGEPRVLRDHLIRIFSPPSKILGARVPLALAEYDAAHRTESGLPLDG